MHLICNCHDPNLGSSDIQRGPKPFPEAQEFELPEIVAGATSPTDRASLVPTVNRSSSYLTHGPCQPRPHREPQLKTTIVFLPPRRSRSHQPRRNRSPGEAVRAVRSFDVRARDVHAPPPEIVSIAIRRRRSAASAPPSSAITAGINSGKTPPPSSVAAGDRHQ
ncbi:hypothetical protein F2Q69_00035281 [Brassica cretica]|uniref:Uncharacterized protein n=1 Tax=Brassica cretica TaxID=69181 RepID=A0A8S9SED7_BRACR|nr:hypothetical protein F2Q69_00035281 [Brassica cretica]